MKVVCGLFLCLIFTLHIYSSTLIFKTTKTVSSDSEELFTDLALVDASKYKKIRFAVKITDRQSMSQRVNVYGVEDTEQFYLTGLSDINVNFSSTIEIPPTKLLFQAKGKGVYKIYIWAD